MNRLDVVEQIVSCTNCELHERCTTPVPFRGPVPARIAIVGEAPGRQEDEQGKPFIGPSGELLSTLLAEVGITEEVAVLNTVSCFPDGTPTWDHIHACNDNKWAQIEAADPTYVLLLGRVALKATRSDLDLRRGRGRPFLHRGRIHYATYHPAAALRSSSYGDSMRSDLERFKEIVDAGVDEWNSFIPNICAACAMEACWWEAESGLGWCPVDMPSAEQAKYQERKSLLSNDIDDVRAKLAPSRASESWVRRLRTAEARAQSGMAAAEANADPVWIDDAWSALVSYLQTNQEFFVDDFWMRSQLAKPREARALGPLVSRAAREGFMEKSGQFRKSVASNMTEKPVWRSLIFGGTPPSA